MRLVRAVRFSVPASVAAVLVGGLFALTFDVSVVKAVAVTASAIAGAVLFVVSLAWAFGDFE